jgi:hypothetical protein
VKLVNAKLLAVSLQELEFYAGRCDEERLKAEAAVAHRPAFILAAQRETPLGPSKPSQKELAEIVQCLTNTKKLCQECGWWFASEKIDLILTHLEGFANTCDWSSLGADVRNVIDVVMSSMWLVKFVNVPTEYGNYVNNPALLGEDIHKAFPSAAYDLEEAGNCISVGSGTAAVFHLMRAVEWGIRSLSVELGVLDVPRKNTSIPIEFAEWDKILDQLYPAVQKKVDALPPGQAKQEVQEFYFTILHDIRGFKDAFRNHVMHTRKIYSQKAADDVLDFARKFFGLLSTKITE